MNFRIKRSFQLQAEKWMQDTLVVDDSRKTVHALLHQDFGSRELGIATIVKLAEIYELSDEIAGHSFILLDRYLSISTKRNNTDDIKRKMEAVSMACVLLICKLKGGSGPALEDLARFSSFRCSQEEIRKLEENLLGVVGWDLHVQSGENCIEKITPYIKNTICCTKPNLMVRTIFLISYFDFSAIN
jgi:hypothetical protein